MNKFLLSLTGIMLGFIGFVQSKPADSTPLVSPTNPFYLSCTYWSGKGWSEPTARTRRTQIYMSATGDRAYAEVKVNVRPDKSCENVSMLLVQHKGSDAFRLVYSKVPTDSDGNGMRIVGWSVDGTKLLAEVNLWKYESDTGFERIPVVYDATTDSAQEFPEVDELIRKQFSAACDFDHSVSGWMTADKVRIEVTKPIDDPTYEQKPCVLRPRSFSFDLTSKSLVPVAKQ